MHGRGQDRQDACEWPALQKSHLRASHRVMLPQAGCHCACLNDAPEFNEVVDLWFISLAPTTEHDISNLVSLYELDGVQGVWQHQSRLVQHP